MRRWSFAVAALLLAGLAAGCAQERTGSDRYGPPPAPRSLPSAAGTCACEPGAPVVDPALLAFLSKARAAHHEADLADGSDDRAAAIRALERLVAGPVPPSAPEVAEVLADTRARLADLRSASGDFDAATRDVEAGLLLATEPTHFRGHLLELRGVIAERRSMALKEKGDLAGAEAAKQAAMKAFEEAIAVQDDVITRALGDAGPAAAPR